LSTEGTPQDPNDDPERPFGGYRPDGLYVFGPTGMRCSLAALIEMSKLLRVTASSPDGERKQRVTYKGREAKARQVRIGGYWVDSGKRPTSGRKRRAAA
jgi:hypothetical protein